MQLKIDRQLVTDEQSDVLHIRFEARSNGHDLVIAGLETSYEVLAVSIRPNDPAASKLWLNDSQTHVRHDRAGSIPDYSLDGSLWSLREESVLEQKE